jgi:preprotein translocase subunit SecE
MQNICKHAKIRPAVEENMLNAKGVKKSAKQQLSCRQSCVKCIILPSKQEKKTTTILILIVTLTHKLLILNLMRLC